MVVAVAEVEAVAEVISVHWQAVLTQWQLLLPDELDLRAHREQRKEPGILLYKQYRSQWKLREKAAVAIARAEVVYCLSFKKLPIERCV